MVIWQRDEREPNQLVEVHSSPVNTDTNRTVHIIHNGYNHYNALRSVPDEMDVDEKIVDEEEKTTELIEKEKFKLIDKMRGYMAEMVYIANKQCMQILDQKLLAQEKTHSDPIAKRHRQAIARCRPGLKRALQAIMNDLLQKKATEIGGEYLHMCLENAAQEVNQFITAIKTNTR